MKNLAEKRKMAAYFLMALGALGALIFAAGPVETNSQLQGAFVISLVILGMGAILRRQGGKKSRQSSSAKKEGIDPASLLEEIALGANELSKDIVNLSKNDALEKINLLGQQINSILEMQQSLLDELGFARFAEAMTHLARGERYCNRARSACIDSYPTEAERALVQAHPSFKEAAKAIKVN